MLSSALKHLDMGSRFLGHLNLLVNTLKTRRGGVQFLSHVFLCNLIFWRTLKTLLGSFDLSVEEKSVFFLFLFFTLESMWSDMPA